MHKPPRPLYLALLALLLASLACSLFNIGGGPTPTPTAPPASPVPSETPLPTPTQQPLPPALVESDPPPGVELPLEGPLTLYFNQPMDRASVEAALVRQPNVAGRVEWSGDSTLIFSPNAPLDPESELTLGIGPEARSAHGLALTEPVSLTYRTAGFLQLAQRLPDPGASEVDPRSAVVAAFNRPVVPLGADPASLPPAFQVSVSGASANGATAAAPGQGEWINTSTYIFYPEPALGGGQTYTVTVDPALQAADGSPLEEAFDWSFTTALPRLLSVQPQPGSSGVHLGTPITLNFNQSMDPASTQAAFRLAGLDGVSVPGSFTWNDDHTILTYQPRGLLSYDMSYQVTLSPQAQALGGTALAAPFSATFITVPRLAVRMTQPAPGALLPTHVAPAIYFTGPLQDRDILSHLRLTPAVSNLSYFFEPYERVLRLFGDFAPNTEYSLSLLPSLPDKWGNPLGQEFALAFRTAPLDPGLVIASSSNVLFLTPRDPALTVQATNLSGVPLTLGGLPLPDFFALLGNNGYELGQSYQPAEAQSWEQALDLAPDQTQPVQLYLSPDQQPLGPGLYFLRFNFSGRGLASGPFIVAVSDLQVTLKISATDALVWAVDLRTNSSVAGAPVTIYNEDGSVLASGQTGADGVYRATVPPRASPYSTAYAVVAQPGQPLFGLSLSTWEQGLASWDFGLPTDFSPPQVEAYLYTDRPIYRPGDTVYFRAIVRQAYNGRYNLADLGSLPLTVMDGMGTTVANLDLPLSAFGAGHGQFSLPAGAQPGYYNLNSEAAPGSYLSFQVANYRKPEINLQAMFSTEQALAGEQVSATVNARYFFDAPAGNVPVQWTLYAAPAGFSLPGYRVGLEDTSWFNTFNAIDWELFGQPFGRTVASGEGQTGRDGLLTLDLPTQLPDAGNSAAQGSQGVPQPPPQRQRYTLEVTAQDESGLPVSARATLDVHTARFYIGVEPDTWVGQANQETGFNVQVTDWEAQPAGAHTLRAEFNQVEWVRRDPPPGQLFAAPTFTPQYTLIASTDFSTSDAGQARVAFTPPEPGAYQLSLFGLQAGEEGARTEILVWVGGPGQAVWPNLPNQRLRLTADREGYAPGETAQVFVPNPFPAAVPALVTVERGVVLRHTVLPIEPGGSTLPIPLTTEDAPNVYLSVTLVGQGESGQPDFRAGYVELPVEPAAQTLSVALTADPERAGPGEEVSFEIQVSDAAGQPVEGEFSLAVVDLAVLALADPNSPDILAAFYGPQPLGVRTGYSLAAYTRRRTFQPEGRGGGGGGGLEPEAVIRERFPDTAFWNAAIVTGPDGRARVSLPLPDTLTTWQVEVRGLSADTRVGQAQIQVVTSKDLLVRPVTPRFLVAGDRAQLAAIVQNNTATDLPVEVSLQADGFSLEDSNQATQQVTVPAGGRARLEWWGVTQDVPTVDLVFSARSGGLQDAARPNQGALPVSRYTARQTFRTAGTLDEGEERLELVSLPRAGQPVQSGSLDVELSPSLAAVMMEGLEVLEHFPYECTEQTLSRFLPNLEVYRALQEAGVAAPALQARLDRTLAEGLQRLQASQNPDGGWSWWPGDSEQSDPTVSAYVLFGLARARAAGVSVAEDPFQRAVAYLQASLQDPATLEPGADLDHLAFAQFALVEAGAGDSAAATTLFARRDELAPWARGLLALAIERQTPGSPEARTLISDLQATALRSATGAHWELPTGRGAAHMVTPLSNTALVVYALAQRDPGSALLPDAVRYLVSHRQADGGWPSTYTTAWALLALTEVMQASGEMGGGFGFAASLNGAPLASGQAAGPGSLNPVVASVPLSSLYPDAPNALLIQRQPGAGRLYYTAALNANRPVEGVAPFSQGLTISRAFYESSEKDAAALQNGRTGQRLTVRLTLTLPREAYYLLVEDFIPAGAEILDTSLKTSQLGEEGGPQAGPEFDPNRPFESGWGWWYFHPARVFDDHIAWAADYLPAGTYELTYTLVLLQPGEYRVLPARGWQFYFPEVQGHTAGEVFTIDP